MLKACFTTRISYAAHLVTTLHDNNCAYILLNAFVGQMPLRNQRSPCVCMQGKIEEDEVTHSTQLSLGGGKWRSAQILKIIVVQWTQRLGRGLF